MMILRVRKIINLIGLCIVIFTLGGLIYIFSGNNTKHNVARDQEVIQANLKRANLAGRVLLIHQGKPQLISIGFADKKAKIKNSNERVIYPTASLEKPITATMIFQLLEEKKDFDLNTKISRWYPKIAGSNDISVSDLLTQTSGITDPFQESDHQKELSQNAAVKAVYNRLKNQNLESKGHFSYNNDNFVLLAGIIMKETGQSFTDKLQKRIIQPLELKHTFVWSNVPKQFKVATSYHGTGNPKGEEARKSLLSEIIGAGSLYSTPEDYFKFLKALSGGKLISRKNYVAMQNLTTKSSNYSGGFFTFHKIHPKNNQIYGNLAGTYYLNWVQVTPNLQNGFIGFFNGTPKEANWAFKQTMESLFEASLAN